MEPVTYIERDRIATLDIADVRAVTTARLDTYHWQDVARAFSQGSLWYLEAHETAQDLTAAGLHLSQTAGILSAYSQNTGWAANQTLACAFCSGDLENARSLGRPKAEAIAALPDEAARSLALVKRILNGMKLMSFADNIHHPDYSLAVTLDVHMLRFFGLEDRHLIKRKIKHGAYRGWDLYNLIAEAIRMDAIQWGMLPHHLQAAIWILQRGAAK